jgi:hypothetical protein
MVCLANSWRPGGHCVAGIDLDSGEWIRPVPKGARAIPDVATHFGKHDLAPLDVIELEVAAPRVMTKYQRENRIVTSSRWKLVDTLKAADVVKYCDKSSRVLHGTSKVVDPGDLEILPPAQWHSLELRHVSNATYSRDPRKQDKWVVAFSTSGRSSSTFSLSLTDPVVTGRLNDGRKIGPNCLLTLSLTEPIAYTQFNLPELCYKLVAAVIPL